MVYKLRDRQEVIDVLEIVYNDGYTHINGNSYDTVKKDVLRAFKNPMAIGDRFYIISFLYPSRVSRPTR